MWSLDNLQSLCKPCNSRKGGRFFNSTLRQVAQVLESNDHLKGFVKQIRYANGTESIEMLDLERRLDVVAATRDGSRGRTAMDFLFIDELREINEEGFQSRYAYD
jgi:hypothetical protein